MKPGTKYLLGGGIVGLLLILSALAFQLRPYQYHGSVIQPAAEMADFTLHEQIGRNFHLSDLNGKIVLIFFGFTNCKDVCPITLSEFVQLDRDLKEKSETVAYVFVTVDPQRDTVPVMRDYLLKFNPAFIGLTGSEAELKPVYQQFGVFRELEPASASGNYQVAHTSQVYLLNQKGQLFITYPYGTDAKDLLNDVLHLLKEG